jgi:hypothetical protein
MTDRRIIEHIATALRNGLESSEELNAYARALAAIAANAYEEAREVIPDRDQPTRFTVKGRGVFPADMLRHDHCWPVDGDYNRVTDPALGYPRPEVTITLCAQSGRRITPARWQSLGWIVTDIDGVPTGPL